MIDIQWGNFIFKAEGTAAILIIAIPVLLIMQLPYIQKLIHAVVRRGRSSKIASSIAYRIRKLEREK